ncbi:unnamed protein product [Chondrus crispus]|uniref:Uncharacterized protein n=1 Tax=Chondrus crispus TaxID=2769 RepID=R7Q8K1_CHOCR|nr:unnamed protein product [Chondrus crispus]CDF34359.1 unnamed protein product [Chondrus crispus]|eukprot:XP_005714178.1 unnamed protein product [Chondrus crispus]
MLRKMLLPRACTQKKSWPHMKQIACRLDALEPEMLSPTSLYAREDGATGPVSRYRWSGRIHDCAVTKANTIRRGAVWSPLQPRPRKPPRPPARPCVRGMAVAWRPPKRAHARPRPRQARPARAARAAAHGDRPAADRPPATRWGACAAGARARRGAQNAGGKRGACARQGQGQGRARCAGREGARETRDGCAREGAARRRGVGCSEEKRGGCAERSKVMRLVCKVERVQVGVCRWQ